jgi:hypothetical protein
VAADLDQVAVAEDTIEAAAVVEDTIEVEMTITAEVINLKKNYG